MPHVLTLIAAPGALTPAHLRTAREALDAAKRMQDWIEAAVALRYEQRAIGARAGAGKDTGTVRFQDGSGLVAGRTDIRYRGVAVGEVRTVEVSEDRRFIEVTARLRRSAASFARSDSLFWIVRLQGGIDIAAYPVEGAGVVVE